MLQITLFGGFRLALDHAPLPPIPSHTARSLFAFLVCHADQDHTRSRLIGHFYPDLPEATARRRLSQALWQIRNTLQQQGLEKSVFLTDGDTVRWHDDLPYALDVADFTAQLGAADQVDGAVRPLITSLTAAANLYTGDLLDGLYDEWILPLRERLRTRYAALLTELIQLHKSQGDYERSLHYARQSLRINPLSEAGHREVMRLCHLLGRTNEALRQYDTLRELLDEEFAAEPAAETRTLYRQITGQSTGQISGPSISETTDQPTPRAPLSAGQSTPHRLVGRGAERQQLIALVEQALGGSGTVALIEGEPGIGKSRLLAELTDDATWRGLRVLATQGREVALQTPFAAVRDLLHQELTPLRIAQLVEMLDNVWLAEIVAFLPALAAHVPLLPARARLDEDPDQTRLTEALRCVFQALGQLTPYLLIIDDLQWVDTDSLQMVQRLLPTLQQAPCCLCLAFRSDEARARGVVWELVRTLDLAVHSQRLLLTRLQIAEIEEILRHAFGAMPDAAALADELTRQSGGNPLFIHETLRALADHGLLQQAAGGQWAIDLEKLRRQAAVQPTPQLRQVVAARLTHLDDDCCALLNTVATLGAEFDLATLRAISPCPIYKR
ncbi:MAG: BTAD domain-containing putative transcriptional regulator [Caldilineaceae bacterium]